MEWLIFLLGIALLEMLFQVLVSTRLEKTLTNIKKVIPHSEYPKKLPQKGHTASKDYIAIPTQSIQIKIAF